MNAFNSYILSNSKPIFFFENYYKYRNVKKNRNIFGIVIFNVIVIDDLCLYLRLLKFFLLLIFEIGGSNILALPFMHDEHNITFDKKLHNLDRRLHNVRKQK